MTNPAGNQHRTNIRKQQAPRGRWRVLWTDPDGRPRQRTLPTWPAARKLIDNLRAGGDL